MVLGNLQWQQTFAPGPVPGDNPVTLFGLANSFLPKCHSAPSLRLDVPFNPGAPSSPPASRGDVGDRPEVPEALRKEVERKQQYIDALHVQLEQQKAEAARQLEEMTAERDRLRGELLAVQGQAGGCGWSGVEWDGLLGWCEEIHMLLTTTYLIVHVWCACLGASYIA